jgi:hypothetical protein
VNDGSGPEASQEFDRVAAETRDARFRFLTTENRGPGAARNAAAEAATGELLLFFDANGLPKGRDFVATLVRALRWSGVDCLTCAYDIVSADCLVPTEQDVVSTYRPFGPCLEAGFFQNVMGDATMMLPRSVFTQVGGFPTARASWEAQEFLLRLCFQRFKLETFPEALIYSRVRPSGSSQSLRAAAGGAERRPGAHHSDSWRPHPGGTPRCRARTPGRPLTRAWGMRHVSGGPRRLHERIEQPEPQDVDEVPIVRPELESTIVECREARICRSMIRVPRTSRSSASCRKRSPNPSPGRSGTGDGVPRVGRPRTNSQVGKISGRRAWLAIYSRVVALRVGNQGLSSMNRPLLSAVPIGR